MDKKAQIIAISLSFFFYAFSAALLIILLEACTALSPKGVTQRSLTREERVELAEIRIKVIVIDNSGQTVPSLGVTAQTSRSSDADITNSEGVAVVNVVVPKDDSVEFHFVSDTIDWTETLFEVPQGAEDLSMVFKLDKLGRIRLGTLEY